MFGSERERAGGALVLALALHALLFVAVTRRTTSTLRIAHAFAMSTEIDLEPIVESATASSSEPAIGRTASATSIARRSSSFPREAETPGEIAVPEAESSTAPEPEAQGPTAQRPLSALGIGSTTALVEKPHETPPDVGRAASERVGKMLNDELARRDREKGLGADGPVISALERATYASGVPGNASALFVVRIDGSGKLASLDVISSNGDREGWSQIARRALGTLGKRRLRVPAGSHGMELEIRVSSRSVLPSGADPGLEVRTFGKTVKKGQGKRSAKIKILEPVAKMNEIEVPTPGGDTIKYPWPEIGIVPFGYEGDPSDIGSKPRRLVHATVVSQSLL